ncbi:MAG TPA: ABC transporter permease [Candidatus Paceibacterota bacterium]|nr:ABC transporter permease [Candidatus Paceibacterota bacterium]
MTLRHTFQTAVDGLKINKTRAMLTILGVVIGVAAIILVMSIGGSAQGLILGQINSLGSDMVVVQPGGSDITTGGIFSQTITDRDYQAILKKSNVPNLAEATPEVIVPGQVAYEGETYTPTIIGIKADVFTDAFNVRPEQGILFDQSDVDAKSKVAVIGSEVKNKLFGASPAIGKYIKIKDQKFRVVGIFGEKGQVAFFDIDKLVLVPYTSAQTYLLGTDYYNEIVMRADSPDNVDKLVYEVTQTMRESHDISLGEDDDFTVRTQQNIVSQLGIVTTALTLLLAGMVGISLVVGGVGIMNIMLVSVTERTKEIGLRKALGATKQDITRQFLFESVLLTGLGGIIGVIIGLFLAFLISLIITHATTLDGWKFVFPISSIVVGVGMSVGIGLIFGIYPARQAAKKSPIEALRYE